MPVPAHTSLSSQRLYLALVLALNAGVGIAAPPPDTDRAAILAMQGEYRIGFSFEETVALAHGYERAEPYRTGGDEVVILVEDTPERIVLQHLLLHVPSGHVTKHWRQEWTWEAPRRWEFTSDQTWRWREIPADQIEGHWTQCVYEVSDAPRYCGTGRWVHSGGISTWTSDTSWRPLPRRDYTKRSDYNALGAINRHTITPAGWTHEQDNLKAVRSGSGEILGLVVREFGFNDYRRTSEIDFSPVYHYWNATAGYWADIRARWEQRLQNTPGIHLASGRDGMALIEPMFQHAHTIIEGGTVGDAELDALFAQWVKIADDDEG